MEEEKKVQEPELKCKSVVEVRDAKERETVGREESRYTKTSEGILGGLVCLALIFAFKETINSKR
ncbi:MAG: hypothetical protein P4M11_00925 [Candidatus Pacebacteria bacterium]|nr:hypothetical protein [Candidatus Paceibacterota bacterium]